MGLGLYDKALHEARYFLLRRLPPCKAIAPLMSESLERRLTLRERVTLKLHLWVCIWCVWYLEHLRLMRRAVAARAANEAEGNDEIASALTLSAEARERLKQALRQSNS
jgi:hypothetical protein